MALIISHYTPPKSSGYGHTPRIRDLATLADRVDSVRSLMIPELATCGLWIVPNTRNLAAFHIWRKRLGQAFPEVSIPESMDLLARGIDLAPKNLHADILRLAELVPLPTPSSVHIQISLCLNFTWRGFSGDRHEAYEQLPGGSGRDNWSNIHFSLGKTSHVFTQFVLPVRHDCEEGRKLITAFDDVGLVELSDKHFKLMHYNPKSKKWSPARSSD